MEVLVIFTSEEDGVEEILKILADRGVERGVVLESQGMRKVLGEPFVEKFFGIPDRRRPFNRTIMAIVEKENVQDTIKSINNFWKSGIDKERKKNRVMFSLPLHNLTIGV